MKTYNWEILFIDKRPSSIFFCEKAQSEAHKKIEQQRENWEQFNEIIFFMPLEKMKMN
jgi:hypothetical protein